MKKRKGIKYRLSINQVAANRYFPRLYAEHLMLLDWLKDFAHTGQMEMVVHNGKPYYWINYLTVVEQNPIIAKRWKKKDSVYRGIKLLRDCQILEAHPENKGAEKTYFAFGSKYHLLINEFGPDENPIPYGLESEGHTDTNPIPYGLESEYNNTISDKNISNKLLSVFSYFKIPEKSHEAIWKILKAQSSVKKAAEIFSVVDHFNKITGKSITYKTYTLCVAKALKKYSIHQVKLIIDYRYFYFTKSFPKPENINLDTFLRVSRLDRFAEESKAWKQSSSAQEVDYKESENEHYVRFMDWMSRSKKLSSILPSEDEFEKALSLLGSDREKGLKYLFRTIDTMIQSGKLTTRRPLFEQVLNLSTY